MSSSRRFHGGRLGRNEISGQCFRVSPNFIPRKRQHLIAALFFLARFPLKLVGPRIGASAIGNRRHELYGIGESRSFRLRLAIFLWRGLSSTQRRAILIFGFFARRSLTWRFCRRRHFTRS